MTQLSFIDLGHEKVEDAQLDNKSPFHRSSPYQLHIHTPIDPRPACVVCGGFKSIGPRGMCLDCYKASDNKKRSVNTRRVNEPGPAMWDLNIKERLPDKPTKHMPGTEEKIVEMHKRAARCESLFHPQDSVGLEAVADLFEVVLESFMKTDVSGIYKDGDKYRARPWHINKHCELGSYREREKAVDAFIEWKERVDQGEDPHKVALTIRKRAKG